MRLTDEQLAALRDGGDELRPTRRQLLAELRERGSSRAAAALAEELVAERAVAAAVAGSEGRISRATADARLRRGYADLGGVDRADDDDDHDDREDGNGGDDD